MENTNEMLNYVKQKALKDYFNSGHDFFSLFPEENFDFSESNYTHFLYFDKSEGEAFLLDFLLFVKNFYKKEVFYYDNYFSVLEEFKKFMEENNVFFYSKTKMGLDIANNNNESLLNTLKNLFGASHFASDEKKIAFNDVVLNSKESFTYDFFNYLLEKLDGYNNGEYIVEPLLEKDLLKIRNYYKGFPYNGKLPFYLDPKNSHAKETKAILIDKLVAASPEQVYAISKDGTTLALVIVDISNNVGNVDIVCDSDYYDSQLDSAISFISHHLFEKYDISKITTINQNKGISFSSINSALVIAQFKPDYSLESNLDGYSKIKYELLRDGLEDREIKINNSIIKFCY